jgi:MFS family permease
MAISQFSIGLWKWEYSIFLRTLIEPWQMGLVFSSGTLAGIIGGLASGMIADRIGRRKTLALSFIPIAIGLVTMSFYPLWPLLMLQWGLIWSATNSVRIISGAMPADEIAKDKGRNPAQRFMMVTMPLWFVDGLSPLLGAFLLSSGFTSSVLHLIASFGAIAALVATLLTLRESLDSDLARKARKGPSIPLRGLGRDYWKIAAGMASYIFFWSISIQYLGNLCVDEWGVDTVTYGMTWSAFSLTSAGLMYFSSKLADKNLKVALTSAVAGNGLVFIAFGLGEGAPMMFLINFLWAIPFIIWIGSEKSLIMANVPEEAKGRALGTYGFTMNTVSIFSNMFGAILWELTNSLRFVWVLAGSGMLLTTLVLIPILKSLEFNQKKEE